MLVCMFIFINEVVQEKFFDKDNVEFQRDELI